MDEGTARWTALAALGLVLLAYVDAPFRTFRQRYLAHRWAERMVLFSIELNLVLVWTLAKVLVGRDAAIAPAGWEVAVAWKGAALAWVGASFAIWAKWTLGRWFTASFGIKRDHELKTNGPYGIVRHPIYTGLLLMGIGLGLAYDSWLTVGFALLFAVPLALHAAIEEQMLAKHFGEEWTAYAARTPRIVPGWKPRPRTEPTATPSPPR
jgi:protein-S-isoprenylcysteine O-methyltransferase Ste14